MISLLLSKIKLNSKLLNIKKITISANDNIDAFSINFDNNKQDNDKFEI